MDVKMIFCEQDYPKILDEILSFALMKFSKIDGGIELLFIDSAKMQELNFKQRAKNNPTDVLSFPYEQGFIDLLGSIVICVDFVKQKADELKHSQDDEIALLFTHGLLHILGFDHENDSGQMREAEHLIISHFNLPKSLIIRNSN